MPADFASTAAANWPMIVNRDDMSGSEFDIPSSSVMPIETGLRVLHKQASGGVACPRV
jgi:hypothetical protein